MIRPSHVVCFLAILAQFVFAEWARSQETDKKLERIAADWKRRQERFTRVQYEVRGNVMIPRENIMDERNKPIHTDSESGNIDAPFSWTLLLDFENNRHRLVDEQHYYSVPEKKLFKRSTIAAFDGKSHWVSIKRDGDPERKSTDSDIAIRSGDLRVYRIGSDKFPAFYGHGIVPYAGAGRLFAGQLTLDTDTDQFTIHGQAVYQGRQCIVARTQPQQGTDTFFDELWIDLSRESAVVRHARYGGNTPITDTYVSYRQVQNCWLPDRWEATLRQGRKVINIVQARVESLELQPAVAEADFRIAELPGMLVSVGVIPKWEDESKSPPEAQGVRRFRIDETGHRQEVIFENGIEKHLRPRNWAWWLVGVLLLAVCGAVAIVWRRRLAAKR